MWSLAFFDTDWRTITSMRLRGISCGTRLGINERINLSMKMGIHLGITSKIDKGIPRGINLRIDSGIQMGINLEVNVRINCKRIGHRSYEVYPRCHR